MSCFQRVKVVKHIAAASIAIICPKYFILFNNINSRDKIKKKTTEEPNQ